MLTFAGDLWTNVFNKVAEEFPEVTTDYIHVDAATIFLVTDPARFDVIVTDNLFGDIITDLAAAVSGGIGVAASGNINPSGDFPSMFEPVHGSAPTSQARARPTPPPRSCPSPCCCATSGTRTRRPGSRKPSPPTSASAADCPPAAPPRSVTPSPYE
ncbi:3-isopropylmalate dehydrogenase [Streptomyces violaceorubidus]